MENRCENNKKSFLEQYLEDNQDNALDMFYDAISDISLALSDYRYKNNLSQSEMADKLEVTQPMISKIESGEYNFSIELLCRICDKIGWKFSVDVKQEEMKCYVNKTSYVTAKQKYQPVISRIDEIYSINVNGAA